MGTKGTGTDGVALHAMAHPCVDDNLYKGGQGLSKERFLELKYLEEEYSEILATQDVYEKLEGKDDAKSNGSDGSGQETDGSP